MSIRIVVDSTANMPKELLSQVTVVPLNVTFDQESYIDGVTITHEQFYEKLATSSVLPRTSQPSPDAYARVYEAAKQAGDTLVVLTVSSALSGTCQSATIAAQDYPDNVIVVDTMHVANGFGVLAEYALNLLHEGKSAQEIADAVIAAREDVQLYALLDTLEYLQKGGRISKTAAFAGTLLSLKPLVCIKDGALSSMGKARGMKQGFQVMKRELEAANIDFDKPFLMGYTGLSDEQVRRFLSDSASIWENSKTPVRCVPLCSVVGTHAGPGAVVAAFFKKR